MKIFGATSGNGVEVDSDNNLKVQVRPIALGPQGAVYQASAAYMPNGGTSSQGVWTNISTAGSSYLGPVGTNLNSGTFTLLANGQVLIVAGNSTACYLFDPQNFTITSTGSLPSSSTPNTILLPNGKVLAVTNQSCYLYNPVTGNWETTGSLQVSGDYTLCLMPNGLVLAINTADATAYVYLYNPATGTWINNGGANCPIFNIGSRTALIVLNSTQILMVPGNTTACYILNVQNGYYYWYPTGSLAQSSNNQTVCLLPNGTVLKIGNSENFEIYSPASGTWAQNPNGNTLPFTPSQASMCVLPSGNVLAVLGNNDINVAIFEPGGSSWTSTGAIGTAANSPMSCLLNNGQVLCVPNNVGIGAANLMLFNPPSGFSESQQGTNGDLLSLWWSSSTKLCAIRKIRAQVMGSGYSSTNTRRTDLTAFIVRNYTIPDSGAASTGTLSGTNANGGSNAAAPSSISLLPTGNLTGSALSGSATTIIGAVTNSNKIRTSLPVSIMGDLRFSHGGPLQYGSYVADDLPIAKRHAYISSTTAGLQIFGAGTDGTGFVTLVDRPAGTHPIILAQNEGLVIRMTEGIGLYTNFEVEWEEVTSY